MDKEKFKQKPIELGQKASANHIITQQKINDFAKLTNDFNPIHFDKNYASKTIFKRNIAHGPYILTFLTSLFANELPGPGSVYLSHDIKFLSPVFIDDTITATVEIIEVLPKNHFLLKTTCTNQDNKVVIDGIARIKIFKNL